MRLVVKIDQLQEGIRISIDGRGSVFDDIFIEKIMAKCKVRGYLPAEIHCRQGL